MTTSMSSGLSTLNNIVPGAIILAIPTGGTIYSAAITGTATATIATVTAGKKATILSMSLMSNGNAGGFIAKIVLNGVDALALRTNAVSASVPLTQNFVYPYGPKLTAGQTMVMNVSGAVDSAASITYIEEPA